MAKSFKYNKALTIALAEALRRVFGDEWFMTSDVLRAAFRSDELSSVLKLVVATIEPDGIATGTPFRVSAYIRHINKVDCDLWCERKEAYPVSGNNVLSYRIVKRATREAAKPAVAQEAKPEPAPAAAPVPATIQDPSLVVVSAIDCAAAAIVASQERCATRIIDAIVDEFRSALAPAKRSG